MTQSLKRTKHSLSSRASPLYRAGGRLRVFADRRRSPGDQQRRRALRAGLAHLVRLSLPDSAAGRRGEIRARSPHAGRVHRPADDWRCRLDPEGGAAPLDAHSWLERAGDGHCARHARRTHRAFLPAARDLHRPCNPRPDIFLHHGQHRLLHQQELGGDAYRRHPPGRSSPADYHFRADRRSRLAATRAGCGLPAFRDTPASAHGRRLPSVLHGELAGDYHAQAPSRDAATGQARHGIARPAGAADRTRPRQLRHPRIVESGLGGRHWPAWWPRRWPT